MVDGNFTQSLSAFIPEVWSKKLGIYLQKNSVMMQCVNRNYEGEIANIGDTVNIITAGDVTVGNYDGGIDNYNEIPPSSQTLLIDQIKYFAFKVNDIAKAQSVCDIIDAQLSRARKAIELETDSFLLAKHADVHSDNIIGSVSSPINLTAHNIYKEFVKLAQTLKNAGAIYETGKKPWVVINPDIEALLLCSNEFVSCANVGDKTLREGSIGKIAGLDVLVSTNLSASNGIVNILAGTNDAITFASQVSKIETIRDKDSFSDLVRGLYVYGAKTVLPKALAKLTVSLTSTTVETTNTGT